MKDNFYNLLKGKFLISDEAFKNWRFIIFLSFLALIMIASSHSADKKVHYIAELNNDVKELKSEYVDVRMKLMQAKNTKLACRYQKIRYSFRCKTAVRPFQFLTSIKL